MSDAITDIYRDQESNRYLEKNVTPLIIRWSLDNDTPKLIKELDALIESEEVPCYRGYFHSSARDQIQSIKKDVENHPEYVREWAKSKME